MNAGIEAVVGLVDEHPATPVVVGVTGAVAVGKSSFADELRGALVADPADRTVDVVSTDGFLLPNHVLSERGLLMRKGFPESYDTEALRTFAGDLRGTRRPLRVPVYSHEIYDIVPNGFREIAASDVVIIEGVNTLGTLTNLLDVGVYLDADVADIEQWFVARFHVLRDQARTDPTSFYAAFVDSSDEQLDAVARQVWREVNLVNLHENIAPSKVHARCVVTKDDDHSIRSVTFHDPPPGAPTTPTGFSAR